MPRSCSAPGCKSRGYVENITFHRFPNSNDLRQKWMDSIGKPDWEPKPSSVLCSKHFREEDLDRTSLSCVRIRENGIPSLFPDNPTLEKVKRKPPKRRHDTLNLPTQSVEESPRKKKLRQELNKVKTNLNVYKKKVKNLNQKHRRLSKKVANLENIIQILRSKINVSEESCSLLSSLSKTSECLIKRSLLQIKNPALKKMYDDRLKAFAITLHFLSPKAYTYIRKVFNTALPHPRTLGRWYSSIKGDPGFSSEALRALKDYTEKSNRPYLCSLVIDSMAIRKHLEWDGKRFHGTVNVGSSVDDDSAALASEALVFHLVFVNSPFKIPLGYFFVDGVSGEQLCGLVKQCLTLLDDTGITICSLTCDGTSTNISMASQLGCLIQPTSMKTHFPHPTTNKPIYFFLDPCHMLKLVRNTLGDYCKLKDKYGNVIDWKFIRLLHELQEIEGLHLGNKLSKSHIEYHKQKMKVKLATQVFSNSVADALQYLLQNQVVGFENCLPTIEFLKIFNDLFDILNSRSVMAKGYKKALCPVNIEANTARLLEAKDYIFNLKNNMGEPILKTRRKTGFLGFLVCIESCILMCRDYISDASSTHQLKYLPLYKLSQDHIERLFGYIRSRGGSNNNPTSKQFTGTFKRILLHSEIHEGSSGNVTALDISIFLSLHGRCNALQTINGSTPHWRSLTEEEQRSIEAAEEEDEIFQSVVLETNFTAPHDLAFNIIEYIGGYVSRCIRAKIICEDCRSLLITNTTKQNSLIHCKNRGGLLQPSPGVQKVCNMCENVVTKILRSKQLTFKENLISKMTSSVLLMCVGEDIFSSSHFLNQDPEENHYVQLIRAICEKYFNLRLHHYSKLVNDKMHKTRLRNNLCKTVLFLGQ